MNAKDNSLSVTKETQDFRYRAALLSGGTSSSVIKKLVLLLLDKNTNPHGTICDFGAGNGELLSILTNTRYYSNFSGIDIISKPLILEEKIIWKTCDLNHDFEMMDSFDTVVCSEVIEYLENPRHCFRTLSKLVKPSGILILTMPNNESIRSILGLVFAGHFTQFLGSCYPAHITALVRTDLVRLCGESGFGPPSFYYSNHGCLPKLTRLSWQDISFGLLKGPLFSDNLAMVAKRCS